MTDGLFTKEDILQNLSSKGYFIDEHALDTFFEKWNIEPQEVRADNVPMYDEGVLGLILKNLFNDFSSNFSSDPFENNEQENNENQEQNVEPQQENNGLELESIDSLVEENQENEEQEETISLDKPAAEGESIEDLIEQIQVHDNQKNDDLYGSASDMPTLEDDEDIVEIKAEDEAEKKEVVIEDAQTADILNNIALSDGTPLIDTVGDVVDAKEPDDSIYEKAPVSAEIEEPGERLGQYVIPDPDTKTNDDLPKSNEFKLDISSRTMNMIAQTIAKKISKHVTAIYSQDMRANAQLVELRAENKRLEQRTHHLEEQNKKLRLLLAESNRNLNSYKPSMFGLYKKIKPQR